MRIYLIETVNIHQAALNLTYTESVLLYNLIFEFTYNFHVVDNTIDDIYVADDIFFNYYPNIMFKFMTELIELKLKSVQ